MLYLNGRISSVFLWKVILTLLRLRLCPRQLLGILAERILVVSELLDVLTVKTWPREVSANRITETIICCFVIMIWRTGFNLTVCIGIKIGKCYTWARKDKMIRWLFLSSILINNVTEIV